MKLKAPMLCIAMAVVFSLSCSQNDPAPETETGTPAKATAKRPNLGLHSEAAFEGDLVAVRWDDGQVFISQIDKILYQQFETSNRLPSLPTLDMRGLGAERLRIADTLVENYLLIMEAYDQGITIDDAEKEALRKKIRGSFGSEEEYRITLEQIGQTEEDYIRVMASFHLADRCLKLQQTTIREAITEPKLADYYSRKLDLFTTKHVSQFNEVAVNAGSVRSLEEAKKRADELYEEVARGMQSQEGFDDKRGVIQQCAFQHSDGEAAKYNYGYITIYYDEQVKESYTDECLDALKNLERGQLSAVYQNGDKYAFFFGVSQTPSKVHPFESKSVQQMLPNIIVEEEIEEWKRQLREKFGVQMQEANIFSASYCGPEVTSPTQP
jgi:hypothetical protein